MREVRRVIGGVGYLAEYKSPGADVVCNCMYLSMYMSMYFRMSYHTVGVRGTHVRAMG